jgi:hypothetical protein
MKVNTPLFKRTHGVSEYFTVATSIHKTIRAYPLMY